MLTLKSTPRSMGQTTTTRSVAGTTSSPPLARDQKESKEIKISPSSSSLYEDVTELPLDDDVVAMQWEPTGDKPAFSVATARQLMRSKLGSSNYRVQLSANTSVASTGAGAILQAISLSPAVTSYNEWASYAALFDEVKHVKSHLYLRSTTGDDGSNLIVGSGKMIVTDLWLGWDCNNISTAPASFAAVTRYQASLPVKRTISDGGASEFIFKPRSLPWARTVTPAVQDPPAGVLGAAMLGNAVALSASLTYYYVVLKTTVLLRCKI